MHVPESPLHRDLKHLYAARCGGELEKRVEGFRVDVISGDTIYEIQVKNLYKIKRKIQILASAGYNAVIVHPLQGILDVELPLRRRRRIRRDQNPLRAFIELPYVATTIAMERVALEIPLLHEVRTQKQWRRNRVRNTRLVEVMELWRVDEPGDLVSLSAIDIHCRLDLNFFCGQPPSWSPLWGVVGSTRPWNLADRCGRAVFSKRLTTPNV